MRYPWWLYFVAYKSDYVAHRREPKRVLIASSDAIFDTQDLR